MGAKSRRGRCLSRAVVDDTVPIVELLFGAEMVVKVCEGRETSSALSSSLSLEEQEYGCKDGSIMSEEESESPWQV